VNLGRVCAQLGRWHEALTALRAAREMAPEQRELVTLLAVAAVRCGELPEAMGLLSKRLQTAPNDVDALVTLADVLVEANKLELALELLANALERLPSSPILHARQSAIALRNGNLQLARSAAARQLALTPEDLEAQLYAATLDLMKLDFASAEGRVLKVLELNPRYWRAHYQLGMIYEAMRLTGAAKVAYRMALSNGPKAWQPRNNLAVLLLGEKGGAREAKVLLQEALALGRPDETLEARYNFALACWKLGEKGASERAAREVAARPNDLPVVVNARRFLKHFTGVPTNS
jgi:tetratricopeptide (TPR) repeat protein